MKKLTTLLTFIAFILAFTVNAQVAINDDGSDAHASAKLEIKSTEGGILIPRMTFGERNAIGSPATGLLIYQIDNNPGFYYYNGTAWTPIGSDGDDWSLTGNSGTNPATNFIGTTDNIDFVTRTGTSSTERMRVESDGQVLVDNGYTAPYAVDKFTVRGNLTNWSAINGYSGVSGGTGVYGADGGNGIGIEGVVYGDLGVAIWGTNNNSSGTAVIGLGNNLPTASYIGAGTGGAFTGYHGVYGKSANSSGTGVIGTGNNNGSYSTLDEGSGGAFRGYHGVYGISYRGTSTNGTGVIGVGNNGTDYYTHQYGSGGAFTGYRIGVYGYATRTGTNSFSNRAGGYFEDNNTYTLAGCYWDGAAYGILSNGPITGSKSAGGKSVLMFSTETPEVLYEDFGIGQLVNGSAHIEIDPLLIEIIRVDEAHPLKVFIQLEGDCKGVYVTNKSNLGFDVVELQGGTSNVNFSWQIVATRANEESIQKDGSVEISDYGKRFPQGPEKLEVIENQTITREAENHREASRKNEKIIKELDDNIKEE